MSNTKKLFMLSTQTNGIACIRRNRSNNKYEFLFIRRRLTYAFDNFVRGIYEKNISEQINKMSLEERHDISSCNFDQIWFRMYNQNPNNCIVRNDYRANFDKCRRFFENRFMHDQGYALKRIIGESRLSPRNMTYLWEMPKGYPKKNESRANCAIREFIEETQVNREDFKIIPDQVKCYNYKGDNDTLYLTYYYIAVCKTEININIAVKNCSEISDIRWMTIEDIKLTAPHFYQICNSIIKSIKNRYNADLDHYDPWDLPMSE